jgi:hypothetical protein
MPAAPPIPSASKRRSISWAASATIVRREIRDKERFARIKRRVNALTQETVRPDDDLFRDPLALPCSPTDGEAAVPRQVAALPAAASRFTDQNVTEKELVMICAADIPARNSQSFRSSTRS